MDTDRPVTSIPHLLGVFAGAVFIASAPIFAVLGERVGGVGLWDAAFWRVFFGALAIGLFRLLRRDARLNWRLGGAPVSPARPGSRAWWWLPGLLFAADVWAWHWSFEHTSVANSTLLANSSLILVTLFAWLVWKEHLTRGFVSGAVVAFAGMGLLVLSSAQREPPTGGNTLFGDGLALLTAVFYASYQLSIKRYRRDHPAPQLMFWSSAVAAGALLPVALFHPDPMLPSSLVGWWPLIGLGVVTHACGQGLIAWGLGGVPASLASVTLLVQPVVTAILGWMVLGQALVPWQVGGGALVLVGLFLAIRSRATPPSSTAA